jgi:hypothetical protein
MSIMNYEGWIYNISQILRPMPGTRALKIFFKVQP